MPTTNTSGHKQHVSVIKKATPMSTTLLQNDNNRAPSSLLIVALLALLAYMTLSLSLKICFADGISSETWLQHGAGTGKPAFIDPTCQWTRDELNEVEWLLMTLKCDVTAMLRIFEKLLTKFKGIKTLRTHYDLYFINGVSKTPEAMDIWREYLSLDSFVEHFYSEATFALDRKDFCTYPTISRLSQLKNYVMGSRLLSKAYDLITIEYHSACLIKTLEKLPAIPYLVKDVVDIYVDGVGQPVAELNKASGSFAGEQIDEFTFNVEEAIAKNGHLKDVVALTIALPMNVEPEDGAEEFKQQCKVFFIELEERWQSMEMMSKMLATEGNGIQMFNNYVLRLLIPTKYADACSQLSSRG